MDFITDINTGIDENDIFLFIIGKLEKFSDAKRILIIHPDYTRIDFTPLIINPLIEFYRNKKNVKIDFLNAGGTHRKMTMQEIQSKLGLGCMEDFFTFHNHEFDIKEKLASIGEIPKNFVIEKTGGMLKEPIPVTVNAMLLQDYDLIIALSSTSPHEAAGFSGGLKVFFPGISGPEVINLFHWAAVLVGLPHIIGSEDNISRQIINSGASYIFEKIRGNIVCLNMVLTEKQEIIPTGLFYGEGMAGFVKAYENAVALSRNIHIKYIDKPLKKAVQVMPDCYDEVWLAGKGSYKLQKAGVMQDSGEIIIYAPGVKCFHSNRAMENDILEIGYHCRDYVLDYLQKRPSFNKNVASHVINVAGEGTYDVANKVERKKLRIMLATSVPQEKCIKAGLGYINPAAVKRADFTGPGMLWEEDGGKYLYDLKQNI